MDEGFPQQLEVDVPLAVGTDGSMPGIRDSARWPRLLHRRRKRHEEIANLLVALVAKQPTGAINVARTARARTGTTSSAIAS